MTNAVGPPSEEAEAPVRSTAQMRTGRVGWILCVILLLATSWQIITAVGLLMSGAFGAGLRADEVVIWVIVARILLAIALVCCVLAVVSKRWILLSLSIVLTLVLVVMNLLRWNVGVPS